MNKLSEASIEIMESLRGCELLAPALYEECVGVRKNKATGVFEIIGSGLVVDTIVSDSQVQELYQAYCEGEGF